MYPVNLIPKRDPDKHTRLNLTSKQTLPKTHLTKPDQNAIPRNAPT